MGAPDGIRRLPDRIYGQTAANNRTAVDTGTSRPGPTTGPGEWPPDPIRKTRNSYSRPSTGRSGLLFHPILGKKEVRRVAPHLKPKKVQQVGPPPEIPKGFHSEFL